MCNPHHQNTAEECHRNLLSNFYKALATRDATTVHRLLTPDIEWWFHGPPSCNRLMGLLTGCSDDRSSFTFDPLLVVSIGCSMVVAEGYLPENHNVSWVHALTVVDGIITQVREYYNTSVTVTRFAKSANVHVLPQGGDNCQCVWQSMLTDHKSMPGLLIVI
ncbi:wound-induced protein 1-like [Cynara cardunculus var. scolymus]|uniref:wound-induced protein 1-like n=1 Tax=Cynara cardunculus var. scolymus TaxID=59895 RepID=UPI000D629012|nr:wound-induced protein 1-like [Cynara cardunculus var. scolymus]